MTLVTLVKAVPKKAAVAVRVLAEFECKHCLKKVIILLIILLHLPIWSCVVVSLAVCEAHVNNLRLFSTAGSLESSQLARVP